MPSEYDESIGIHKQLSEVNKFVNKIRFSVYRKMSKETERVLLNFRDDFDPLFEEYTELVNSMKTSAQVAEGLPADKVTCPRCNFAVPKAKYCSKCGSPLLQIGVRGIEKRHLKMINILRQFEMFQGLISEKLSEAQVEMLENIAGNLQKVHATIIARQNFLIDTITRRRTVPVRPQPIVTAQANGQVQITAQPILGKTAPTIEFSKQPTVQPEIVHGRDPKKTVYSKFERNLVNYWFFYLSIFLLTIGVIITIVFVVREITSESQKLIVINIIGAAILLIGEGISIVLNRRKKREKLAKAQLTEKAEKAEGVIEGLEEPTQRKFPLPEFANVIIFIGIAVLYTASVIGFTTNLPREIFIYTSFGVALLSVILGVINDSEMITLIGFIPVIAVVIMDLTWETPALGHLGVLFAFTIPIIVSTIIAIFFNKWWGMIVNTVTLPIIIAISFFNTQMGLEFIPLALIPISTLLIVRFNKGKIPVIHKKILAILSLVIPMIGLTIISFPLLGSSPTEPLWAKTYPIEIIITSLVFLSVSFFYQFVQKKHLEIESDICIFYYVGQGVVGLISILMVATNLFTTDGFIYSIVYFGVFLVIGFLGVLKFFQKHLTIVGTLISFAIAEIHAVLLMTTMNVNPGVQLGLQFGIAILFTILVIANILLKKVLHTSKALFIGWIVASVVNNIVFIFMQQANYWFVFGSLLLFLVIPALSIEPHKKVAYYVSQASIGVLSLIMVLANLGNPLGYIFSLIYFTAFIVIGILGTIFQNYFTTIGTIISFVIAEVQAILLLILLNTSSAGMIVIYFTIAISFTIISVLNIVLARKKEFSQFIQISTVVSVVINTTLLMFLQKVSDWFILAAFLVFFILPALHIKPNVGIPYYIGQISIGVLASLMIGLNYASSYNYIYTIVAFGLFFTLGVIGSFKKMEGYFKLEHTIISFVFAEILTILSLVLGNTSTGVQIAFYFISAVGFLIMSLVSISLTKVAQISEKLYLTWLLFSVINSALLILMRKVDNWFAFVTLILFFVITAIEVKPNTGTYQLVGQISIGSLSVLMVLYNMFSPNYFVYNTVYFVMFFVVGFLGLLKGLQKYFKHRNSLIAIGFAEVQAILLLSITTVTNNFETIIYFIIAISFSFVAILSLVLSKFFINNEVLLFGWVIIATINTAILGLINKINPWFSFVSLLMMILFVALNNLPVLIQNVKNWRINALFSSIVTAILISVFLFTNRLELFPFEVIFVFTIFALVNIPVFFNWKKEEVLTID